MCPELVQIGPVVLFTYGPILVLAIGAAALYARYALLKDGVMSGSVYNLLFAGILGGVVGARLFYVVPNWDQYAGRLWEVFFLPAGGLVFQGAAIGGALAVWAVTRYERISEPIVMDAAAPALAIGAAIGRLGCLANGCCAGVPTDAWYGLSFAAYSEPRVPIQIGDVAYNALLAAGLAYLAMRPHRKGDLLWLWFAGYGASRFIVEFWRSAPFSAYGLTEPLGLNPQVFAGLTLPQVVAVGMFCVGAAMLAKGRLWGQSTVTGA